MKWHLDFPLAPIDLPADYRDKILLAGSCFAENIGAFLMKYKFDAVINPHGILYNPASIVRSLESCLENKQYSEKDLFFDHGWWHSWDHHERFSRAGAQACLDTINTSLKEASHQLEGADWLILTLGSAGIYRLKNGNRIAGNCHKRPASDFDFGLMTPAETITVLDNFIHRLFQQNSKVKIIFTVSPVRYTRYGLAENNLGKSILLYAVHQLVGKFDRLYYFPAYEIVIDELRDYRFYAEDMVHPNVQAVEYVWDKFAGYFLSAQAHKVMEEIHPVLQAAGHRPLHRDSEEYKKFLQTQREKITSLEAKYPFLNFKKEKIGYENNG
jgi:hypothetical protein